MPSSTKNAITECTIALAAKKPLKKITVNEIVKELGITRNTFYYHFHDIYDVLDSAIGEKISQFESADPANDDKAIFDIIEFAVSYKKVWRNLYKSLGQEALQKYAVNKLHGIFLKYVKSHLKGTEISDTDLGIITAYFEEALFGVLTRWVRGESKGDTAEEMHMITDRIRVIFTGCIDLMIQNIKNNPL